jgi:hypothetical protein
MNWADERYIRVYTRDTADWLALGWEAQALFLLLQRKADRAGIVQCGRSGVRGLAALVGMPPDVATRALAVLLEDGCLQATTGGFVFPEFLEAQEATSSDAARQRKHREKARATALANASRHVTSVRDIVTSSVTSVTTRGHVVTEPVTSVTPSRAVPSRAVPSRAEPVSASQALTAPPPGEELPDMKAEAEEVRPELELVAQEAEPPGRVRKQRTPSKAEVLYAKFEEGRAVLCREAGVTFIPSRWPFARVNKLLKPLAAEVEASEEAKALLRDAFDAYGEDPDGRTREPPFSLEWFLRCRSKYEGRALKAAEEVS